MTDTSIRFDLIRLAVLMGIITLMLSGLKIYDQKTNQVGKFGSKIYNEIFNLQ